MRVQRCGAQALEAATSLLHFFAGGGLRVQHVRRLVLHLTTSDPEDEWGQLAGPLGEVEAKALENTLASCIAMCTLPAGCLEELVLSAATPLVRLPADRWEGLASLRVLWIGVEGRELALPAGFSGLTALRELGLRGSAVSLPDGLPAGITKLNLTGDLDGLDLQQQVS